VAEVAPRTVGYGIIAIGGGRRTIEDLIDPAVGFVIDVKPGDSVRRGDLLATVHARNSKGIETGLAVLEDAIRIDDEPGKCLRLVSLRVTAEKSTEWVRPE
jgi:thymidine phosphorylase